ncbi:hypothetical protein ACN082_09760 [Rothia sp. CCM 9417]|uniref:hypothetical protein n=1 Tax=Rothia sp. CCM 9417 TaxID=3402657 RepID=UPI003AEB97A4
MQNNVYEEANLPTQAYAEAPNTQLPAQNLNEPRQPQDHLPSREERLEKAQKNFSEVPGSQYMVPFRKIKGSDQMRIINRLRKLMPEGTDAEEFDASEMDLDDFADFVDYLADNWTVDKEGFESFTSGSGGMVRTLELAMAFADELGKDMP